MKTLEEYAEEIRDMLENGGSNSDLIQKLDDLKEEAFAKGYHEAQNDCGYTNDM